MSIGPARAQSPAGQHPALMSRAPANSTVSGTVTIARGDARIPARGVWVTLHRVGRDSAGPVDSVRTGASGAFRFRYLPGADAQVVYFVSTERAGIAYFSARLPAAAREAREAGDADLTVYDTTSRGATIDVASRHIIVSAADTLSEREITEVYILANAGSLTLVADASGAGTFQAELPAGARDPQAGEGDVSPAAVRFAGRQVTLDAPIPPGTKRFSVTYRLATSNGGFVFDVPRASDVVEVLVADSAATVAGGGMHEESPIVLAGRPFLRFVGHGVAGGSQIRVLLPPSSRGPRALLLFVAAMGVVMAVVLGVSLLRGRAAPTGDAKR